jgi:peptidoglycan/LPS O-acetylase OafA/YrhL
LLKLIPLRTGEVVAAALYFWNYYPGGNTWFLAHTWSLAIEEQFYFLWPVILRFASKRRGIQIAAGVIGLSPLVRVATYALFPHLRSHIPIMFHTRADSLMFGAAAALLYEDPTFQRLAQKCFRWHLHLLAALFVFVIGPQVELHLRGAYTLPIGWTLNGVAVVVVLVWAVQHESTLIGRLLNSRFIVHVGAISYSIYLWQEVFLAPSGTFAFKFPLNFLLAFVAAELSYRCVEQPFLRMRSHLAARRSQEQLIEKTRSLGVAIG